MKEKGQIHYPKMWKRVFEAVSPVIDKLQPGVWDWKTIPVSETGYHDKRIETIVNGRIDAPKLLVLPLTHAALHTKQLGLKVLGAFVSTRDDIFVFRKRVPPPKLGGGKQYYKIGIKDPDITTTHALRLAMSRWDPDPIFLSHFRRIGLPSNVEQYDKAYPNVRQMMKDVYRFMPVDLDSDRLKRLVARTGNETIDAAIFMGDELICKQGKTRKSMFSISEVVDTINLNRILNNIYGVKFFPRALIVVSESDIIKYPQEIEIFCRNWNSNIDTFNATLRSRRKKTPSEERVTKIGPECDVEACEVILDFISEIHGDAIIAMRQIDTLGNAVGDEDVKALAVGLHRSDFAFATMIFTDAWRKALRLSLEQVDAGNEWSGPAVRQAVRTAIREVAIPLVESHPNGGLDLVDAILQCDAEIIGEFETPSGQQLRQEFVERIFRNFDEIRVE